MAEMISKFEVVGNLIALENEYQFHKEEWDAQTLYRKICELELTIGKRDSVEVVRCKDCKHCIHLSKKYKCDIGCEKLHTDSIYLDFWCRYGERKDNA